MSLLRHLAIYNLLAFLFHLLIIFLIQFKIINQQSVGEVSDKYPSLFTPAGITFSIWLLIYVGLGAFTVYHLLMAYRQPEIHGANIDLQKAGYLFITNNLATTTWLIAWVNEWLLVSVILIIVQLITLILLHNRLCIHDATRHMMSKICTQFPISIYFAWITIATIANISTYLTSIDWSGWGISEINWTITMIGVALIISSWVMNRRLNVFYGLVIIWALYGIILKRQEAGGDQFEMIIYTSYGAIVIIAFHMLIAFIRNMRKDTAPHTNPIAKG